MAGQGDGFCNTAGEDEILHGCARRNGPQRSIMVQPAPAFGRSWCSEPWLLERSPAVPAMAGPSPIRRLREAQRCEVLQPSEVGYPDHA